MRDFSCAEAETGEKSATLRTNRVMNDRPVRRPRVPEMQKAVLLSTPGESGFRAIACPHLINETATAISVGNPAVSRPRDPRLSVPTLAGGLATSTAGNKAIPVPPERPVGDGRSAAAATTGDTGC